jgi:Pycsar effector protein
VGLFHRRSSQLSHAGQPGQSGQHAPEFAWRVHEAQETWGGKADVKASILLAIEGGALFAVVSAHAKDGLLTRLAGWHRLAEITGIACLLVAVSAATIAVFPRIGKAGPQRRAYRRHLIYFGHLRHWDASDLKARLENITAAEELDVLSQQLVEIAKLNWSKHRWIQVSLLLALSGILVISVAAATAF